MSWWDSVTDVAGDLWDGATSLGNEIVDSIKGGIQAVGDIASELGDSSGKVDTATDKLTGAIDGVDDVKDKVNNTKGGQNTGSPIALGFGVLCIAVVVIAVAKKR
ncbi:hypothetical protein ACPV36_19545 [Photobacterium damselae]|uniref:hypothetical protein n=1 Tax=Photobacterium damselae TaxID=38293 RepID=UPI0040683BDD